MLTQIKLSSFLKITLKYRLSDTDFALLKTLVKEHDWNVRGWYFCNMCDSDKLDFQTSAIRSEFTSNL